MLKKKILLLAALIVPTIVSAVLAGLTASKTSLNDSLIPWIQDNRGTIQTIVQLLSTALGALQTFAITSAIRFEVNLRLSSKSVSLDGLKLWNAVISGYLDADLPIPSLLALCLYLVLIRISNALWAGAITPIITTSDSVGSFQVPAYSAFSNKLWGQLCVPGEPCDAALQGNFSGLGTFTYLPWKYKSGLLLNSITQVSNNKSSKPQITKLDNTGFTYNGRSYGVASTTGLVDPTYPSKSLSISNASIQQFSYFESGYASIVTCDYNRTGDFRFYPMASWGQGHYPWNPVGFIANGSLPNGKWAGFPTWGVNDNSTLVAIGAVASQTRYMYGVAAGSDYALLNKVECEVAFTPSLFRVYVDMPTKIITVTPATADEVQIYTVGAGLDIDSSRALANSSFFAPSFLSATLTSGYTSVLGRAFEMSVNSPADGMKAVADGFEILIDHTFGSLGAAQLMLGNDTRRTDASVTSIVLHLGEQHYVYAVLGVNLGLSLCIMLIIIWTRFWRGMPTINVLDLKSAILGAAAADHEVNILEVMKNWDGNGQDRVAGGLKVKLTKDCKRLAFVP
ncbi:hypothetical protein BDZ45DRAFT_602594 [Acephala macrosclerotiorum]|nr:hypothetical protein BDZ45DRAFT_602594 [Acephala macrosclerotiorum]